MRKVIVRALLVVPALALIGLVGCSNKGSSTGNETASGKADYAVKVSVKPSTATVPTSRGKLEVVFTITNEGKNADTYSLETGDEFFGKKVIGNAVPATVTLKSGESKILTLPLTFEGQGSVSVGFEASITAISQGHPATKDKAACKISFK